MSDVNRSRTKEILYGIARSANEATGGRASVFGPGGRMEGADEATKAAYEEDCKPYYDAIAKTYAQLGDHWTENVTTVGAILVDINAEMTKKLERNAYNIERKITISIPRSWMDLLKDKPAPYGPRVDRFSCWDYIMTNNLLASIGAPYEILPRYRFKDVVGTFTGDGSFSVIPPMTIKIPMPEGVKPPAPEIDPKLYTESWIGKKAQESGDKLKAEIRELMEKPTRDAYDSFTPQIATGEQLDKLMTFLAPDAISRTLGLEEGHPDAVPDPIFGGFMESDDSLRKRALAAHREMHPQMKTAYANLNEDGSISVHGIQKPDAFEKAAIDEVVKEAQEAMFDYLTPIKRFEFELDNGAVEDPGGYYVSYDDHLKKIAYKDAVIERLQLRLAKQGHGDYQEGN